MERNYIKEGLTKTIKIDKSKRVSIYIYGIIKMNIYLTIH